MYKIVAGSDDDKYSYFTASPRALGILSSGSVFDHVANDIHVRHFTVFAAAGVAHDRSIRKTSCAPWPGVIVATSVFVNRRSSAYASYIQSSAAPATKIKQQMLISIE